MSTETAKVSVSNPGKLKGSSPSEDRFYIVVLFDISHPKKYRTLVKLLKGYGSRVQKSVFECQLTRGRYKKMMTSMERLMASPFNSSDSDNVRVYKIAGSCEMTVFGDCPNTFDEENIFL